MTTYSAPLRDISFALNDMGLLDSIARLPGCEEVNRELTDAIVEEAGKLARDVLAPLNAPGDRQGAVVENGVVRTADGFRDAYHAFVEGGWPGIPFDADHGGQGLPWLVAMAAMETWLAANTAWSIGPMLTIGAVELLSEHGSEAQQKTYLPKLVSGEWTGTMNLTEPQAGSDLGALKTRAVPDGDAYRITGQKIFITYGEHDYTDNIVHLVLARTPDAPAGSKGISLFIVPKFLVNPDGSLGRRNDLRCVSLEHKLGIHASPICVMSCGDGDGAVGYLVGKESEGLRCMFTMMNNARMNIGLSGLAIAERAYQQALDYARTRIQFGPIIKHPDVRRMLMTMKALTESMRLFTYDAAVSLEIAKRHTDKATRAAAKARIDLLTPVVKAWCTDSGVDVASLGIQIHGGMGFIEETGAAQHYRDARIAPIYEGTNGIQAIDLVTRKVLMDGGAAARTHIAEMRSMLDALDGAALGAAGDLVKRMTGALDTLAETTDWLVTNGGKTLDRALAGASPYLRLFGIVAGGAAMAKAAGIAAARLSADGDDRFYQSKLATAGFYGAHILPQAHALADTVMHGAETTLALDDEDY
jgi:3-(methylsulfanyl)propanoyl-CoA dehydrogenase